MKRLFTIVALITALCATSCSKYKYERVADDPLKTRIYTLDNGLKVYMTVNKETPRIQTYIAVRVGAKNDPVETTGLAHYFEHLMFKGTKSFGTQDYAAEKPMLDEIERLFEVYRNTTDPAERTKIYAVIDSVSNEASKISIPNEYDKLMSAIGATGSNAWTSYDETVYTEDIPSNQIENWAKIQSDRFANAVIRGFHTELETVYEEYNMSLAQDGNKAFEGLMSMLFPDHPYGQHSVLGTQEHLKNPSITNIKNYYNTYYVPNNMAICLSGDLDPDKTIAIIDKYFGGLKPNPELPEFTFEEAAPFTEPKSKEVYGIESDFVYMGWRTEGGASKNANMYNVIAEILYNGKCGLMDVDLLQAQKVLYGGALYLSNTDLGAIVAIGYPKEGQRLEEVRDLILGEVAKLRNGEFDEEILKSVVANYKRNKMQELDSNDGRASQYVSSFINGTEWADEVHALDEMGKLTKEQIVAWVNENMRDDNYVVLYKRHGEDKNQKKIEKPHITPIETNRDAKSEFLAGIQNSQVEPIQPVFVDFDKDMSVGKMGNGTEVLYKQNRSNGLFSLMYLYEFGRYDNPKAGFAINSLSDLLGTETKTVEQIKNELYSLACDFSMIVTDNRSYIMISGLGENMEAAMEIVEDYLRNVKGDDAKLAELKKDKIKEREVSKLDQYTNFNALTRYVLYGAEAVKAGTLTNKQIEALTSDELVACIKALPGYKHRVMYYGPLAERDLIETLDRTHRMNETLTDPAEDKVVYLPKATEENSVVVADYDSKQIFYTQLSKRAEDRFSADNDAIIRLYNEYFGGGMNAIVFQEMREARGLAYSAWARLSEASSPEGGYFYRAFIATQNDKMKQAIEAFESIINDMPQSQAAFDIAKQSMLTVLATDRTIKDNVLWQYVDNQDMGVDFDRNKAVYEKVQNMTLDDVVKFQQEWIKDRKYTFCILGDKDDIDINYLKGLGKVSFLSQEEIFGY